MGFAGVLPPTYTSSVMIGQVVVVNILLMHAKVKQTTVSVFHSMKISSNACPILHISVHIGPYLMCAGFGRSVCFVGSYHNHCGHF